MTSAVSSMSAGPSIDREMRAATVPSSIPIPTSQVRFPRASFATYFRVVCRLLYSVDDDDRRHCISGGSWVGPGAKAPVCIRYVQRGLKQVSRLGSKYRVPNVARVRQVRTHILFSFYVFSVDNSRREHRGHRELLARALGEVYRCFFWEEFSTRVSRALSESSKGIESIKSSLGERSREATRSTRGVHFCWARPPSFAPHSLPGSDSPRTA